MARPVVLSNGSMMVGLNKHGLVHDFYYPYVGLENLTTSRSVHHYIGVWVGGVFSWVDDGSWNVSVDFETDALVSTVRFANDNLQIEMVLRDFVDNEHNAFLRKIQIINNSNEKREVRLFMHQVFQISRAGRADTALYVPEENYILDYKGRCCLVIYGQYSDGRLFDQFSVGNYGIEGKEGTYKDAEDGELSGCAVEHGGVDSVLRFSSEIEPGANELIDYWIIAADSQFTAGKIHDKFLDQGLDSRLDKTRNYWQNWLNIGSDKLNSIEPEYIGLTKKSLMIIKAHCDKRGGIIASGDSSIYNYGRDYYSYVWPRDSAYAIWPLIRMGYTEEPKKVFEFCRDIITKDGYLMHKYQPDKAIGSTWHPLLHGNHQELAIQEDETASILYMLGEYYNYTKDLEFVESLYSTLIKPAADFLTNFIDETTRLPHASYDLWEEKFLTTTYTSAVTYQALCIAENLASALNHADDEVTWGEASRLILSKAHDFFDDEKKILVKGFLLNNDGTRSFDSTLDISSFYGAFMYGFITNQTVVDQTFGRIEQLLLNVSPSGGSARYENDQYFKSDPSYMGNPWFVTTLWIAQYFVRVNRIDEARSLLAWAQNNTLPSGVFPEQINPSDGQSISVTPLVWSHAEFVNTVLDLSKVSSAGKQ